MAVLILSAILLTEAIKGSLLVLYGLSWIHSKEIGMAVNVKLPEALVETAKRYGAIEHRSVPKQIEYWSQIGKIAAENPDLPFSVIRDILIAVAQDVAMLFWLDGYNNTKAKPQETMPQLIMIRAIQRRAPTRSMIRLLGTSNRK